MYRATTILGLKLSYLMTKTFFFTYRKNYLTEFVVEKDLHRKVEGPYMIVLTVNG